MQSSMFFIVLNMILHLFLAAFVGLGSAHEDNLPVLGRPVLFGPSVALVKRAVEFYCELLEHPNNVTILLQLFKEGVYSKPLAESTSLNGEKGVFPVVIKTFHDGNLECVARAQNNTSIQPTTSFHHHLRVVEPVKQAHIVVSSGQTEFFEGRTLELQCELDKGSYVTYYWFLDEHNITETQHRKVYENRLRIIRTTSRDSGSYMCIAQNSYNDTIFSSNPSTVNITIMDIVSAPNISFTVLEEDQNYSALVLCSSLRGTPPIMFTLYNMDELMGNVTVQDRQATIKVPIVLRKHLGWLQCRADNGDQSAHSPWIPLEVVPVEGPVTLQFDYSTGSNYAVVGVTIYCRPSKGSHVKFEWFLNKTLLPHIQGPSFYKVVDNPPQRSTLLLAVGRSSAGTYHCEVCDQYDNTTAVRSRGKYLDKEVVNRIPDVVVAVVFGCFACIIGMVCICCTIGFVYRPRTYDVKPVVGVKMKNMLSTYEDNLGYSEYTEDTGDMKESTMDQFDQLEFNKKVTEPSLSGLWNEPARGDKASEVSMEDWTWLKTKTNVLEQEEEQPVLLP